MTEPTTTRLVPCGDCRACCEHELLILHPEHGDDPDDFDCYRLPDGRYALRQTDALACIYLGESGCTIWERRPAVCREFDCRLFLDPDAGAFLRRVSPETFAHVEPAARALVERERQRRAKLKRERRGAIPGRRRKRKGRGQHATSKRRSARRRVERADRARTKEQERRQAQAPGALEARAEQAEAAAAKGGVTVGKYLEEPRNPGKDDGRCALCGIQGLTEEDRCHGCGYLICDEHVGDPWGKHLVVQHDESVDDDFGGF